MVSPEEVNVVLYHSNCPDGFGAAYSAWRCLGDSSTYVPMNHQDPFPNVDGKVVACLDICFSRERMEELKRRAKKLVVLDHHITAMEGMEGFEADHIVFDMEHSGAYLSWAFFHPGTETPLLIRCIEDRDLWRWNIPSSGTYLSYIDTLEYDFEVWGEAIDMPWTEAVHLGRAVSGLKRRQREAAARRASVRWFDGHKVMVVNLGDKTLVSATCNELARDGRCDGIAIAWNYNHDENESRCSIRGIGDVDVRKIAEEHGGGGHKLAAGFSVPGMFPIYLQEVVEEVIEEVSDEDIIIELSENDLDSMLERIWEEA